MSIKSLIESLLFVAGRAVSIKELQKATGKSADEVTTALEELKSDRKDGGVLILEQDQKFLMSSNPENSQTVKDFLNVDLREKLTDAAIETLAIITYKQPVSRAEIEAIRGVNSQYTIRLLAMRGLVEKAAHKDARANYYQTTHEFLQHLGLASLKDLPEFAELTAKVKPPEQFSEPSLPAV
ncbi:MAG: SMC-Scp complex subunit ScpB [Candidatus Doudnabacteria bacterium RIFCSPHIGHO2_01_FULL_49_9]|uniref:SMC-Scp complex subunit ScpB n=1 Tax=Candidatus Doudnabacteria bacterium RIFCSPHIGHO2_01_FULL_49_9 TaxID=1817827 RepID=A0A1F5P305_9BACT|nr:MAG: SMC-Scp complex subunit ScpB [Candidatus Doudnabacteria bacterium RIFCSPHIGHO2_01_FULL_49_9]